MLPAHFGAPPTSTVPAPPDTSFQQQALINALHEMSRQNQGAWIVDSGASSHFTANKGILHNSAPSNSLPPVIVGNGNSIPITHIGHTSFPINPNRPPKLFMIYYLFDDSLLTILFPWNLILLASPSRIFRPGQLFSDVTAKATCTPSIHLQHQVMLSRPPLLRRICGIDASATPAFPLASIRIFLVII
jgi:hypothetical protein